jgi:uncharacterized membrane protein
MYLGLKFLHVLLAITALGANLTYGWWIVRARKNPEAAVLIMRTVKMIDDRMANPAYGFLLITGAIMVWVGGIGFGTLWVWLSVTLWLVAMAVGLFGYTPILKAQIAAIERGGPESPESEALSRRANAVTVVVAIAIFAILYLMIFKPGAAG